MEDKQMNDPKGDSPTREDAAGCYLACMIVVAVTWLLLVSITVLAYLSGDKYSNLNLYLTVTFLTIVFAALVVPVWGICLSRMQKGGQNRNNAEAQPRDIPTTMSCGCAAAVGLFWFISAFCVFFLSDPGNDPLLIRFMEFTVLCVFVELPLLIFFAYRNYRRDQNRKSAQPREPFPRGEAVPAGEADRENEIHQ